MWVISLDLCMNQMRSIAFHLSYKQYTALGISQDSPELCVWQTPRCAVTFLQNRRCLSSRVSIAQYQSDTLLYFLQLCFYSEEGGSTLIRNCKNLRLTQNTETQKPALSEHEMSQLTLAVVQTSFTNGAACDLLSPPKQSESSPFCNIKYTVM